MDVPDEVIDAARAVLPGWTVWLGPACALALAALAPFALLPLALAPAARRARRAADGPWTEAARLRWPVVSSVGFLVLVSAALFSFVAWNFAGTLSIVGPRTAAALAFAVALCSSFAAGRLVTGRLPGPPLDGARGLRGTVALWWILLGHALIVAPMFLVMPTRLGAGAAAVVLGGALVLAWWLRGGVLGLPRALGVLEPAEPELAARVERLAAAQGVERVRAFELRAPTANAFAVLLPRAVVLTRALREALDDDQLDAIVAHEVAHLGESRSRVAAFSGRLFGLVFLPLALPLGATYGVLYAFLAFLPTVALLVATRHMPRKLEEHADERGAAAEADPGVYARALEAMHRVNLVPAVLGGQRAHPDLYDRMLTAGVQPDYPRPEPPSRLATRGTSIAGVLLVATVAIGAVVVQALFAALAWQGEADPFVALALDGGDPELVGHAAEAFEDRGQRPAAAALRRYVAYASVDNPWAALVWAALDAPPATEVHALAESVETALQGAWWRDVWAELALAELWLAGNDPGRAVAARARADELALDDEHADPNFHVISGRIAAALDDGDLARLGLARAEALRTGGGLQDDPRLTLVLADLARRVGDAERSAELEASAWRLAQEQGREDELERLAEELAGRR